MNPTTANQQAFYLPPAEILSHYDFSSNCQRRIFIVTGGRGAGKTTWCASLARQAQQLDLIVEGFLSPAEFNDGKKTGFLLVNLASGEQKMMGNLTAHGAGWEQVGCWWFDPAVVTWGNLLISQAEHSHLVIMDEIGPFELEQNKGFLESVRALDERRFTNSLVVIRPELLDQACRRWQPDGIIDLDKKP